MGCKRGSYFFVLDVFIAGTLLFLTLLIILSTRVNAPTTDLPYYAAEDFMLFVSSTEIRDLVNPLRNQMIDDGNITDTQNTIMQQIGEMQFLGDNQGEPARIDAAQQFAKSIIEGIVPSQFGVAYYYDGNLIYNRSVETLDDSELVISSKKITFFRIYNPEKVVGPTLTEVIFWT